MESSLRNPSHNLLTFVEKKATDLVLLKAFSFGRDFVNFLVENESEIDDNRLSFGRLMGREGARR